MTYEALMNELKRLENKLREINDSDSLVVAEARGSISDWKAKYEMVKDNLLELRKTVDDGK